VIEIFDESHEAIGPSAVVTEYGLNFLLSGNKWRREIRNLTRTIFWISEEDMEGRDELSFQEGSMRTWPMM
jgi:hypothetical protein